MKILPPRLRPDHTIAILAPASPLPEPRNLARAVKVLHGLGFKTKLGRAVNRRRGFLAGTDAERVGDIHRAFADPRVDGILCLRGGHGVTRLLPLLDFKLIAKNPKVLVGYSDLTALLLAIQQRTGLITFHGPMLNTDFVNHGFPVLVRDSFFQTLTQADPAGGICSGIRGGVKGVTVIRAGVARGELIGGNLTLLSNLMGTPWQPDFRRKLVFLEEVNEAPYRVDRLLTHLLNAGVLQQAVGIAIGQCAKCEDVSGGKGYRQTLEDVLRERLSPLKIPVLMGLPFGHVRDNVTLPIGLRATLDTRRKDLIIEQTAVS